MGNLIKKRRYWFVLVVQVFLFFLTAFTGKDLLLGGLFVFAMFGIFGAVILSIWTARFPRVLAIVTGITAVISGTTAHAEIYPEEFKTMALIVSCVAYAGFIMIAIISIGKDVLGSEHITLDTIFGSITVYMFLGMFFAFLYAALSLVIPNSFHLPDINTEQKFGAINNFMYFSYSTLTTTGFGDITPAKPFIKMLAALEGIVGTLYIAVMIARLVSMHVAKSGDE